MSDHYILDGHKTVPVDMMTWARSMQQQDRHVARSTIGGVDISTVFLGLDHAFGGGQPKIFETMIFGGWHDQYQDRYSTWEEAEAGHRAAERLVRRLRWIPKDMQYTAQRIAYELRSWWGGVMYRRRKMRV